MVGKRLFEISSIVVSHCVGQVGWKFLASQRKHFESNLPHLDLNQFFPQQKLNQKLNPKIKHTEFQQIQQKSKKCQSYYSFSHLSQYGLLWKRAMHSIQLSDIKYEKETASEFSLEINQKYLQHFNSSEQILGNICLTLTSL